MIQRLQAAIDTKDTYYEDINDEISAVSGTIHQTIGIRPGNDATIQRLRDRAKTTLLSRKQTKKQKTSIDVPALIELIDNDGNNKDLETKKLRAKLIALMILDSAARPDSIRNCTAENTKIETTATGRRRMICIPTSTKDQAIAKDKTARRLIFYEFPFRKNICTLTTYEEYKKRFKNEDIVNDLEIAGLDEKGKPTKKTTHTIMLTIPRPHRSIKAQTVRSECRKYLERLQQGTGPAELRKAVPSLIQYIENAKDDEAAKKFRWQREDTFKTWYKVTIPDSIKAKLKDIDKEFPTAWKLRCKYIPKTQVHTLKERYKTTNKQFITSYMK